MESFRLWAYERLMRNTERRLRARVWDLDDYVMLSAGGDPGWLRPRVPHAAGGAPPRTA